MIFDSAGGNHGAIAPESTVAPLSIAREARLFHEGIGSTSQEALSLQKEFMGEVITNSSPLAVCYGMGVDSTAMLIGLRDRGIRPDWITFSDTGGEKPETYAYVRVITQWLHIQGFPRLRVLRYADSSKYASLEDECLRKKIMPGLAFGRATCSIKWKQGPFKKFMNRRRFPKSVWGQGGKIVRAIGFECDETHRVKRGTFVPERDEKKYVNWFPLVEWVWDRARCAQVIQSEGLPLPPKSACWFCPASKPAEIVNLQRVHPDLLQRAIEMEARALPRCTSVKGLGRKFAWKDIVNSESQEIAGRCDAGKRSQSKPATSEPPDSGRSSESTAATAPVFKR